VNLHNADVWKGKEAKKGEDPKLWLANKEESNIEKDRMPYKKKSLRRRTTLVDQPSHMKKTPKGDTSVVEEIPRTPHLDSVMQGKRTCSAIVSNTTNEVKVTSKLANPQATMAKHSMLSGTL
jgi:hypothetical protein